jgi:hypothetical protein
MSEEMEGNSFMVRKSCGCVVCLMHESYMTRKKMVELLAEFPSGLTFQYVGDDYIHDGDWNWASNCTHKETPTEFLKDIDIDVERLNQYSMGDRMAIRDALSGVLL